MHGPSELSMHRRTTFLVGSLKSYSQYEIGWTPALSGVDRGHEGRFGGTSSFLGRRYRATISVQFANMLRASSLNLGERCSVIARSRAALHSSHFFSSW